MPGLRNVRPNEAIAAFEDAARVSTNENGEHFNVKMATGMVLTFSGTRGTDASAFVALQAVP